MPKGNQANGKTETNNNNKKPHEANCTELKNDLNMIKRII